MLVYGRNVLKELDRKKIRKIYVSSKELIPYLNSENLKYDLVPKQRLDNMTKGNHQGIIVEIYDYEYYTMDDIDNDFVVILDHLEDPHNFGAIIRTCECAGITNIIIPKDRSVMVTETVMKTSAGTLNHVNIIRVTNLVNAINYLKDKGFFIYGAEADGVNYKSVDYSEKRCLVMGSEGKGISPVVRKNCDVVVSLPMKGHVNSLNVSVATAIFIYEMGD